jgi:hypothetical protein
MHRTIVLITLLAFLFTACGKPATGIPRFLCSCFADPIADSCSLSHSVIIRVRVMGPVVFDRFSILHHGSPVHAFDPLGGRGAIQ